MELLKVKPYYVNWPWPGPTYGYIISGPFVNEPKMFYPVSHVSSPNRRFIFFLFFFLLCLSVHGRNVHQNRSILSFPRLPSTSLLSFTPRVLWQVLKFLVHLTLSLPYSCSSFSVIVVVSHFTNLNSTHFTSTRSTTGLGPNRYLHKRFQYLHFQ